MTLTRTGGRPEILPTRRFRDQRGELPGLAQRITRHRELYPQGHSVQGRAAGAGTIALNSNDYLALANHPRIVQAQIDALSGSAGEVFMSAVFLDEASAQRRFERQFADYLGTEDAVLTQSGFAANDGLVQVLADAMTPVYVDIFAHMSLWQGAQSAGVKARPFRHNSVEHLRELIQHHGPGIILVDAIYSTSGELCPLAELAELSTEQGCVLVVDESHALGVVGPQGRGLVAALGLGEQVDFRTFSLSKAFVGRAGAIAGPARVMDFLRFQSRPAIFSSAVLEAEIARFAATLDVIRAGDERRRQLGVNTAALRDGLLALGYDVSISESQILPLVAGPEPATVALRRALERRDVIGAVFCAPATPKNRSLVRFSVTSGLTAAEIERTLAACAAIRDEVRPQAWPVPRNSRPAVSRPRPAPAPIRLPEDAIQTR